MSVVDSYKSISENKTNCQGEDNWCLIEYDFEDKTLKDTASGKGFASFLEAFDVSKIQFGFLKVVGVDERDSVTSMRPKLVQVNWVGGSVKPMRRMASLSQKAEVAKFNKGVGVTIDADNLEKLTMNNISLELVKAGAAHKPTFYHFGGAEGAEEKIMLDDVKQQA